MTNLFDYTQKSIINKFVSPRRETKSTVDSFRKEGGGIELERPVFSVTEFYTYINELLGLEEVVVEGEISEAKVAKGYLVYFIIKDESSSLPCLIFKNKLDAIGLSFDMLEQGINVKVVGVPNVYAKRGEFKLLTEKIILSGEGALKRAFDILKKKLEAQGLFRADLKRPIPPYPEAIGLITSEGAAAYTDFIKVLKARWGGVKIYFYHASVQGESAIQEILEAFAYFNTHFSQLDAIVLTRGGGSLEDLTAFNAEAVVRAIRGSKWPVLSAVGHERDESLADFAADLRASTPSNAAELLTPTRQEERAYLDAVQKKLVLWMEHKTASEKEVFERALVLMRGFFQKPKAELTLLHQRLERAIDVWISRAKNDLAAKARLLQSFDPHAVLKRGYSITQDELGTIITSSDKVLVGTKIKTSLYRGALQSQVTEKS